jgi:hypothetical protein
MRSLEFKRTAGVHFRTILFAILLALFSFSVWPQENPSAEHRSQEISEDDGQPVLIKHLPDWQNVRETTVFATDLAGLKKAAGDRVILNEIDLSGGSEAVTAVYPAGRLVIVEFMTPQASADADARILQKLAATPENGIVYRRIGNYNAFVFDASSHDAAAGLLDEVKYQKSVQWLGEDPFLLKKLERYFVTTTRDIFISTVLWIVGGLGIAIVSGLIAGIIFYRFREHQRATWTAYSDAGGLTRLNLDELSE